MNRKQKSKQGQSSWAKKEKPLMLAGLRFGDACADLWAFRYDESKGRFSHVLTCSEPRAWRFEEIGGRARDLVGEVYAEHLRAMPEKCDDDETAEWLFGAVYSRTLDVVNDLGDMWTVPDDRRGVDADFVVAAMSPFRIGLVSRFARDAVGLPVVFVDENLDGVEIGEPSGPRWLRLADEDLRQAARPLPERIPDGFAAREGLSDALGPFADCVLGGYPLERAFDAMCAVVEWWGRALGCRAEAFGVECAARSVKGWLAYDAVFTDDGLRDLSRRVRRLDDAAQDMALAILRGQDRRAAEVERAELLAGKRGGRKGKRGRETALSGVRATNAEVRQFYDDHKKDGEKFAVFWERCKGEQVRVCGVSMPLSDVCKNDFGVFEEMCENGGRAARRKRGKRTRTRE